MADLLVIHWDRHALRVIQGHASRGVGHLRVAARLPWPSHVDPERQPASSGGWLKGALSEAGIEGTTVRVLLPRDECVLRRLELPNAPDEELPDLVRLQAATVTSAPMERVMFDYLPLPGRENVEGRSVLLAIVFRERVETIRSILNAAGLELESVGISSCELAELFAHFEPERADARSATSLAYVQMGPDAELVVFRERTLVLAQSLETSDDGSARRAMAQLGRLLVPLESLIGSGTIDRASTVHATVELRELMQQRLGCAVNEIDPFQAGGPLQVDAGVSLNGGAADLAAAGALLGSAGRRLETVDFLNPRKPAVRKDYRRQKLAAGIAAAVLLLVGAYAKFKWDEMSLDDQIANLQKTDGELAAFLKRGQPTLVVAEELELWSARRVDWLEQVQALSRQLPRSTDLYLTDLRAIPGTGDSAGRVRITGYARERSLIDGAAQRLRDAKYRVHPQDIRYSARESGFPYRFEIDVDLLIAGPARPTSKVARN